MFESHTTHLFIGSEIKREKTGRLARTYNELYAIGRDNNHDYE